MTGGLRERHRSRLQRFLPARKEYIVSTSEFDEVKARLAAIENRRKVQDEKDSSKPSLRRTASTDKSGGKDTSSDDGHPTLKRRPDDNNN